MNRVSAVGMRCGVWMYVMAQAVTIRGCKSRPDGVEEIGVVHQSVNSGRMQCKF